MQMGNRRVNSVRILALADADYPDSVTGWLESHGIVVNSVYPNGVLIDFSGSAGQIASAFHTEIHNLSVGGVRHIANIRDPRIPAAIAPAVAGIVSLHDFRPHTAMRPKKAYTFVADRQINYAVVPADLATIYDFTPLFNKGITGVGQTIVVLEDSDPYTALPTGEPFALHLGLREYTAGSLSTVQHPGTCRRRQQLHRPRNQRLADGEVAIDAEWASAAAPSAAIVVGACADTLTMFGGFIAMQNLVNGSNPPPIVSISYIECEAGNGVSGNAYVSALYQQAAAEGVSVFVASGDGGAASCDQDLAAATHGISMNAWASTAYNVAVGGTDFSNMLDGTSSMYWSSAPSTASTNYGSALSYIPEIPWNGSCASGLIAGYYGFSTTYGTNGFCNSDIASSANLASWGQLALQAGGPSNCATGVPANVGVSNGSCQGIPKKPTWQTGLPGIPNDGVRDLPDVSMFASDGVWGVYYVECFSDLFNGGARCVGAPSNWGGAGGTSFSAPILAGVQALINQNSGGPQGNPNYVYYALAAGKNASSIFHSVTRGDIDVDCLGSVNCFDSTAVAGWGRGGGGLTGGTIGVLSVSSTTFTPAYATGPSWNFATGIGSVDVTNLVMNWMKQ